MNDKADLSLIDVYNKMVELSTSPCNAHHNQEDNNMSMNRTVADKIIKSKCGSQQHEKINSLYSCASHETETPFAYFGHKSWKKLFQELIPYWKPPKASHISGQLLQNSYTDVMNDLIE